jgi:hypothetical protein
MSSMTIRSGGRLTRWTRPSQWLPRRSVEVRIIRGRHQHVTWYTPWRGYRCSHTLTSMRGGSIRRIDYPLPEIRVKQIKVGGGVQATGPRHLAAVESVILHSLPAVVAHLAVTRYDDGTPRRPGWITVSAQGAVWRVVAKDPDAGASLMSTGNSVDDALALMELLLGAEDAPWEVDPYLTQSRRGGRKSA